MVQIQSNIYVRRVAEEGSIFRNELQVVYFVRTF